MNESAEGHAALPRLGEVLNLDSLIVEGNWT